MSQDALSLREQLKAKIYADILAKIMHGQFQAGQRLVEEELARTYEVSRTPIREILFALEKGGLIERTHNRGAKVVSFTPDDVEEIYEIRGALECLSLQNAVRNLPLNALLALEHRLENLHRQQGPKWNQQQTEVDLELHGLIVTHSGNRRLIAYLDNISLLIHSLRLVGYRDDRNAHRAGEEHLEIVRALLKRDLAVTERLLADHIENSKKNAIEVFLRRDQSAENHPGRRLEGNISKRLPQELRDLV
jgi:DNA-binding GntR family transcriptional regulator